MTESAAAAPRTGRPPQMEQTSLPALPALAECAEPKLLTREEAVWLPPLDAEVDNFRAALDWRLTAAPALALRLAGLLDLFWSLRNSFGEALELIEAALKTAGDDAPISDSPGWSVHAGVEMSRSLPSNQAWG